MEGKGGYAKDILISYVCCLVNGRYCCYFVVLVGDSVKLYC